MSSQNDATITDFLDALHKALDAPHGKPVPPDALTRVWAGWPAVQEKMDPALREPMKRVIIEALSKGPSR
jgi:hypothetical protein